MDTERILWGSIVTPHERSVLSSLAAFVTTTNPRWGFDYERSYRDAINHMRMIDQHYRYLPRQKYTMLGYPTRESWRYLMPILTQRRFKDQMHEYQSGIDHQWLDRDAGRYRDFHRAD